MGEIQGNYGRLLGVRGLVTALVQLDAKFNNALCQSGDKSPHSKEAPGTNGDDEMPARQSDQAELSVTLSHSSRLCLSVAFYLADIILD